MFQKRNGVLNELVDSIQNVLFSSDYKTYCQCNKNVDIKFSAHDPLKE